VTLDVPDRLAVADLVHLYAAAVDDRRFDDVVALFTDAAELWLPDPPRALEPVRRHHGHDGVGAAMAVVAGLERTEHAVVGEVYADGPHHDYALGRIACVAHHWTVEDGRVTDVVWHLRYDDEYQRTASGWRIHGRALTINAIETRPARVVRPHPPRSRPDRAGASGGPATAAGPSAASPGPPPRGTRPPGRSPGTP
jgi:hypothetical protein